MVVGSGPSRPTALTERAKVGAVCTMETTETAGLGPTAMGALNGLDTRGIGSGIEGFSAGLDVASFWASGLDMVAFSGLSDCFGLGGDGLLAMTGSLVALLIFGSNFSEAIEEMSLEGLLEGDVTYAVLSPDTARSAMLFAMGPLCKERVSSS